MDEPQQPDLPDASATDNTPFPVVGIGASAGGLPALIRLLENLPPAPGMALVVVLHLAPDAPSAADRVLQRATTMPVRQVADRMPLRPNQVYVISPGRSLRMEDGHLIAQEPPCALGVPMTINIFLRTLAEAHGERAIGVLLSGMGSDGVAGLACIKEHGGVSIAQLPGDAEERSMPQAAIDSGMVDFVLPAARIPARLLEMRDVMQAIRKGGLFGNAPSELPRLVTQEPPRERLEDVLSLLYAHTGQDFHHYKQATVLRRIERRMQVRAVPDLPAYQRLLRQDPQEPDALVQEMLIGVTNFFRDRAAFDVLERMVLPRIFHDRKPSDPLRAWVTACSTGEEAYSLAMLLAERAECIDGAPAMQIFATDIDERAITVARNGRYPDAIVADVPHERLARYFTREDSHFRVRKLLRDRILFARHDLLHDPAFSRLDLITCRNVLIYLNREVHRQLLELFHCALNPGGFLFLGSAESADLAPDLFTPIDTRHRMYQARPAAQGARRLSIALPRTTIGRPALEADQARPDPVPSPSPTYAELHQRTLARLAPPSVLVDAKGDILHASDGAGAFLRFGGGEPSTQVLALVLPELCADLRTALFQAHKSGNAAPTGPIRYRQDGEERAVELTVVPVREAGAAEGLQLVRFDAVDLQPRTDAPAGKPGEQDDTRVRELEQALQRARLNLQQTLEQADAANAGLIQANARLQASVEGLREEMEGFEIHREEMQSRNEELYTVNAELQARAEETAQANDDLSNLIASTDIATLFLDPRLRIQRYTPSVARIFNIIPADIGRPLAHLASKLETEGLLDEVVAVFASGEPTEHEARSSDGCDYIVRVHPYRTAYDRVEGAVLTFFDISSRRQAEKALRESEQRLATAFAALPLGLGIVGKDGGTIMLNEDMRRFMPSGLIPSRDPARTARWRGWDAAGALVGPENFPGARALRGESVMRGMQMLYTDDEGRETWTEVRSAPLLGGEGAVTGALVVVIDVDRLKRSEEAARQSAQRQAFLLELGDALRAQADEHSIKELAIGMLAEHLQLDRCWISEVFEENGISTVGPERFRPDLPPMSGTFKLADYPETMLQLATHPMVIQDAATDARFSAAERQLLDGLRLRALLVAPVRRGPARVVWALAAAMAQPRQWSDGERLLLEEAAERTWTAIERVRAERALQASEEKYRTLFNEMDEAYAVVEVMDDGAGKWNDFLFLDANPAFVRHTGMPYPVGQTATQLLGTPNPHWAELYGRAVETGVPIRVVEGELTLGRMFDLNIFRLGGEGSRRVAVLFRDVTEIHRAGAALRASEERQAFLLKLSDAVRPLTSAKDIQSVTNQLLGSRLGVDRVMFAEVDGEPGAETGFIRTQYIRPADAGRASLGRFPERFDYRSFGESAMAIRYRGDLLVVADIDAGPDFMASERAAWAAAGVKAAIVVPLARGGRLVAEFGVQSATPRDWTEAEVSLVRDVGERTLAAVERAITAGALQESETRFRALAEVSPALIWQLDADGVPSYVNERWVAITGASLEQLHGALWHRVLHPDDAPGYLDAMTRALETQDAFRQRVRVRTRDGGYRWFASYALPWHAADGRFQGMVGMSIDVEEAVEAEDALKTADRRKDEFLATLAHELRNPLAPISNALQFLRYPEGKRRADRLLAMVERQVRHMVRLIDDLMEVTRISRGKVDLLRAPVALADVLGMAVETSQPAFAQKRQQLGANAVDRALRLNADKVRLTQVFANLLNNASKYTAPGGQVWLGVRREGHEVLVTVRDTGMGIPQDQLSNIFEMFTQPHGRDGHSEGGLGIGLAMVRSLVELHGGAVEAHSAGPGQGSEFLVRLPLYDCPDALRRPDAGPEDPHAVPLAGRRILIVDDNRDAADSLCQLLAARGAETRAVYGGYAAIEAFEAARPDAIVLDIGMPEMDGYEVARRIRREEGAGAIRIVALTGWGQQADRERSREAGFDHHLTKPAQLHSLVSFLAGG